MSTMTTTSLTAPAGVAGGTLAFTGLLTGTAALLWWAVALMILGGTLVTIAKLGPRVAYEPARMDDGSHQWRWTVNGKPRNNHARKH